LIALTVKPEHCTGCMACVYACSLAHEEVFSLGLSRMRIEKEEALGLSVPVACLVCEGMPCVETCPVGAIRVDAELGRPVIHEGECTGCGACVEVCPAKIKPTLLSASSIQKDEVKLDRLDVLACINCGSCTFVCPSHIPLAANIQKGQTFFRTQQRLKNK